MAIIQVDWASRYQNVSTLYFIEAKGDGGDNWSYKTWKTPVTLFPIVLSEILNFPHFPLLSIKFLFFFCAFSWYINSLILVFPESCIMWYCVGLKLNLRLPNHDSNSLTIAAPHNNAPSVSKTYMIGIYRPKLSLYTKASSKANY